MTLNAWSGLPDPKMPTASTEQERADFKSWAERERYNISEHPLARGKQFACEATELAFSVWQAARRAQVVPVGWSLPEAAQDALDWLEDDDVNLTHNIRERLRFALSKAPQPPEAECMTCNGYGAVGNPTNAEPCPDCTPRGHLAEAAPVQLPEPTELQRIAAGQAFLNWNRSTDGGLVKVSYELAVFEKVRQLLAAQEQPK